MEGREDRATGAAPSSMRRKCIEEREDMATGTASSSTGAPMAERNGAPDNDEIKKESVEVISTDTGIEKEGRDNKRRR